MALAAVITELVWWHQMLNEVGLRPLTQMEKEVEDIDASSLPSSSPTMPIQYSSSAVPTMIHVDNRSTLSQVKGLSDYHSRSKHIDIRYHYIKEVVAAGDVRVEWIPSDQQRADVLTKALPYAKLRPLRDAIMLTDEYQHHPSPLPNIGAQTRIESNVSASGRAMFDEAVQDEYEADSEHPTQY